MATHPPPVLATCRSIGPRSAGAQTAAAGDTCRRSIRSSLLLDSRERAYQSGVHFLASLSSPRVLDITTDRRRAAKTEDQTGLQLAGHSSDPISLPHAAVTRRRTYWERGEATPVGLTSLVAVGGRLATAVAA